MNLFVYGTLRDRDLLDAVSGAHFETEPAVLSDHMVAPVPGDVVPMIGAAAGQQATGLLLRNIPKQAQRRLSLFEGAWGFTLQQKTVSTDSGPIPAWVYVPPKTLKMSATEWSFDTWQTINARPMTLAVQEVFDRETLPTPAELRILLPMAEKRAWARLRAGARTAPASVRADHDVHKTPDVACIDAANPVQGRFFGMQAQTLSHQRFDGTRNNDLMREVFLGVDAALVLPYDAQADTVLLVEQMRQGPLVLGDPNPWTLEPVAGMVDARETPQEAALREAKEEANLTDLSLHLMFGFYPSPGNSTDYFSCFLGHTDLGPPRTYLGGLDSEQEDLRLHILTFETAMGLARSGEITAGPLLAMLYWLAVERPGLQR